MTKHESFWSSSILLVVLLALMSGCRRSGQQSVGVVLTTLSNPYFVSMGNAAKAEAAQFPTMRLSVQAPEQAVDVSKQIEIVDNLVSQKVGAICLVPADSTAVIPVIKRANQAGVPIIILDADINEKVATQDGAHVAAFIGSDNVAGGRLAGDFIKQHLPGGGEVAILEGVSGVDAAEQRKAGFLDSIRQQPSITVVASQPADWDRERALNLTQNLLQAHPHLSAIFGANDEMALGAVKALQDAGRTGKVLIVGFDATKDGVAAIKRGEMSASVAQMPEEVGKLCGSMANDLINHGSIPPITRIPVKLVTK